MNELLGDGSGSVWIFLLLGFFVCVIELRRWDMQGVEERFKEGRNLLLRFDCFIFELLAFMDSMAEFGLLIVLVS